MRIFDAFPFCDEVDLATLRINYLSKSVDRFIVGEFNTSFSGARKEYNFPRVIERLPSSLRKRIDYYALKQPEPSLNPFENDDFQKNTFTSMFQEGLNHEDYVLLGDCDEFPSIDGIRRALKELVGGGHRICHFAQDNLLGFLNFQEVSGCFLSVTGEFPVRFRHKWIGTVMTTPEMIKAEKFSGLRHPRLKPISSRISKGGWHFSSCNGDSLTFEERFRQKYKYTSHQEFNSEEILNNAYRLLRQGMDPLERKFNRRFLPGKKEPRFRILSVSKDLPFDFVKDWDEYSHLIL